MSRSEPRVIMGSKDGGGHRDKDDNDDDDDDDDDDEVLVILVFFPDWCPHCQGCAVSQQPGHVPQVIVDGEIDGESDGGDCDCDGYVPQAMVNYDRSDYLHRGCCWLCCCPLMMQR